MQSLPTDLIVEISSYSIEIALILATSAKSLNAQVRPILADQASYINLDIDEFAPEVVNMHAHYIINNCIVGVADNDIYITHLLECNLYNTGELIPYDKLCKLIVNNTSTEAFFDEHIHQLILLDTDAAVVATLNRFYADRPDEMEYIMWTAIAECERASDCLLPFIHELCAFAIMLPETPDCIEILNMVSSWWIFLGDGLMDCVGKLNPCDVNTQLASELARIISSQHNSELLDAFESWVMSAK